MNRFFSFISLVCFSLLIASEAWSQAGGWQLRGEFLYFKPTIEQSYYAITSTPGSFLGGNFFPNGKRYNNSPDFRPGVRLEGIYDLCQGSESLDFRLTYFNTTHSDSVSGNALFDVMGFPGNGAQVPEDSIYNGTAKLNDHFRYYAADATFNRFAFKCAPENLNILLGLHYAYIKREGKFTSAGTFNDSGIKFVDNHLKTTSTYWGVGPQIGIDYHYNFNCSSYCPGTVTLFANARGALLCSRTEAKFHYNNLKTGPFSIDLKNDPLWRVSPTVDAKIGVSYHFACHCWDATLTLGYEFILYNDSVDTIVGVDVAFAGSTVDVFSNLSLQGPFLALGISF